MPGYALGLIETKGLPAAIEATDAALKSADVRLIGYERATGGMVTVKIEGEVSAVEAAVHSGSAAASRVNRVLSTLVIARPGKGLEKIVLSKATVGMKTPVRTVAPMQDAGEPASDAAEPAGEPVDAEPAKEADDETSEVDTLEPAEEADDETSEQDTVEPAEEADSEPGEEADDVAEYDAAGGQAEAAVAETTEADEEPVDEDTETGDGGELNYSCNLCHDPACTQKKGQPRASCIHFENS